MSEQGMRNSVARIVMGVACMAAAGAGTAGDYACHVEIAGERPAIVLVDTDTKPNAERAATGAEVRAAGGKREPVVRVVECIARPGARLADPKAQALLDNLPL